MSEEARRAPRNGNGSGEGSRRSTWMGGWERQRRGCPRGRQRRGAGNQDGEGTWQRRRSGERWRRMGHCQAERAERAVVFVPPVVRGGLAHVMVGGLAHMRAGFAGFRRSPGGLRDQRSGYDLRRQGQQGGEQAET